MQTLSSNLRVSGEFSLTQTEYLQLSPFGLFPHARGFQQVDRAGMEALVKNFNSFLARLGRRFVGVPFYVGHPDVRGLENMFPDRKAYGWIMDLEVREDGLYGRPKWSNAGRELIADGHYKFLSPYWTADPAGEHQGRPVFRPAQLISVGLTNEPNLPVLPLANSAGAEGETEMLGVPVTLDSPRRLEEHREEGLGNGECRSANAESEGHSEGRSAKLVENANLAARAGGAGDAGAEEVGDEARPSPCPHCLRGELSVPNTTVPDPVSDLALRLARLEDRFMNTVLDRAIAETRIRPVERSRWREALREDFERASVELANAQPRLNLSSRVEALPLRHAAPLPFEEKQRRILALVNEKMRAQGVTYDQAWSEAKEELAGLF